MIPARNDRSLFAMRIRQSQQGATNNLINALSFDGLNIIKMTLGLIGAEKAV